MDFDELFLSEEDKQSDNPRNFVVDAPGLKKTIQGYFWKPNHAFSSGNTIHLFVVTHGAAGTCRSEACELLCEGLVSASTPSASLAVVAFDGSMNLKSRKAGFLAVLEWANGCTRVAKVTLAGRSMGCRAAAMAFVEASGVAKEKLSGKLILASYPLIGKGEEARKQVLLDLPKSAEVLFAIGSEDEMCPINKLHDVRVGHLQAHNNLLVVKDLNHGMGIARSVKINGTKKKVAEQLGRRAGYICGLWAISDDIRSGYTGELSWADDEISWSEFREDDQYARSKPAQEEQKEIESDRPAKKKKKE